MARINAWRLSQGLRAVSAKTSSYCRARARIPLELLRQLVRASAAQTQAAAKASWRWKGRSVKLIDGTTLSMPDTPANQRAFPQHSNARTGLGFPMARAVAVLSLSTGCVLDMAIAPWFGKLTGEHALLRKLFHVFSPGDLALADRYYDAFFLTARFVSMGVDTLFRASTRRKIDFRTGRRLAAHDHVVEWKRPNRPSWLSPEEYAQFPKTMTMREIKVRVSVPGFRVRDIVLTTTMLTCEQATAEELARLYRERWHAELDLRSIKCTMKMQQLRSLSPHMIEREITAHLLAYNLIRRTMCDAATELITPRTLSFKATLQTVNAFLPVLVSTDNRKDFSRLYLSLLAALRQHRVGLRPNRNEPRAVKHRRTGLKLMLRPRHLYPNRRTSGSPPP